MRKVTVKRVSEIVKYEQLVSTDFFDEDFYKHRDNMKLVSKVFESLSLQDQLSVSALFVREVRNKNELYSESKAVHWLLKPKNVGKLVRSALLEIQNFQMENVLNLLVIVEQSNSEHAVPAVIKRVRSLVLDLKDREDLELLFKSMSVIRGLPSCKWTSIEQIMGLKDLRTLEKVTRKFRSTAQEVVLFTLFKELDFEELSHEEVKLLENIIQNVQDVDPALYLKLTLNLLSHFLLDFATKNVKGKSLNRLIKEEQMTKEQLKDEVPTLDLLEQLSSKEYDPDVFSSEQLMETLSTFPSLTSYSNLSFYNLFPQLGERISHIASLNLKRNYSNRGTMDQLFDVTRIPNSMVDTNAELLMEVFSEHLVNYAEAHEQLMSMVEDKSLLMRPGDISNSLRNFKEEVNMETRSIRTPVLELVSSERYTDLLKLSMFFESCLYYSFPICFYCSQYKMMNPEDQLMDSFFDFSVDLLIYILRMGKVIINKINEFDLEEQKTFVEERHGTDLVKLQNKVSRLEKYDKNNRMVMTMISKSLRSKQRYLFELGKDPRTKELLDRMNQLQTLINKSKMINN
jgi:hypothetical protein